MYETGSAITSSGALSAYSGAKTGRSPSDKRIVREPSSEKEIWWGPVNKEMSPDVSTPLPSFPILIMTKTLLLGGPNCFRTAEPPLRGAGHYVNFTPLWSRASAAAREPTARLRHPDRLLALVRGSADPPLHHMNHMKVDEYLLTMFGTGLED